MLQHPSRHYIYYLLSKRSWDAAAIVRHLNEMEFPLPQDYDDMVRFGGALTRARDLMVIPPNFDPTADEPNVETTSFMNRWGITHIWKKDPFVDKAIDIIFEPAIRRMVEALLLGPLSPRSVADRVANRFGLTPEAMNVQVVKAYSHYFWDPNAFSQPGWKKVFFRWYAKGSDVTDYLGAVCAPRGPAGAALVLALVDRGAESLKPLGQYIAVRDHSFGMFMHHALIDRPSLPRTQAAMHAFMMMKMSDEEVTKRRGGSADLMEELQKLDTIYDQSKLLTVQDLPALKASNAIDTDGETVEEPEEPT